MAKQDKNNKKQNRYNEFFSFFNKEMNRLADKVDELIPDDSPIRSSETFARVFGVLSSWVEGRSDGVKSPLVGALLEKSSDFMEALGTKLSSPKDKEKKEPKAAGGTVDVKTWMGRFQKEALEKLLKADDPDAEFGKLQKRMAHFVAILEALQRQLEEEQAKERAKEEAAKVAATSATTKRNPEEPERVLAQATVGLRSFREQLEAAAARRRGGN